MKNMELKDLMKGVVDIHVHAGPSVAERSVDARQMYELASDAGYAAIVIKDHYFPTMMETKVLDTMYSVDGGRTTRIFGGTCLNNATGAFNLNTVDVSVAMGAKIIWLPTLSAANHIDRHRGRFVGAGDMRVVESPLTVLDECGDLRSDVKAVVEYIAHCPDVVLATGHLSPREIDKVIDFAYESGVRKILVNHPHFIIGATLKDVCRWAEKGAFIEINGAIFEKVTGSPRSPNIPLRWVFDYMDNIPLERLVIDSDSGQKGSPDPVTTLYRFLSVLLEEGIALDKLEMMAKVTPGRLIGL